jgi:hypothetical protein
MMVNPQEVEEEANVDSGVKCDGDGADFTALSVPQGTFIANAL